MTADYTQLRSLEFRRKVFAWFPTIWMRDPASGERIGYIRERFRLSARRKWGRAIHLYADKTKQHELLYIQGQLVGVDLKFDVVDPASGQPLFAMQHRGLRSHLTRDYWDLYTITGQPFGAIQETSSGLALARRWIGLVPFIGGLLELVLAFTAQKFELLATVPGSSPQVAGRLVHRKNPFVVKMGLDMRDAAAHFDTRVGVAAAALLALLDSGKTT